MKEKDPQVDSDIQGLKSTAYFQAYFVCDVK